MLGIWRNDLIFDVVCYGNVLIASFVLFFKRSVKNVTVVGENGSCEELRQQSAKVCIKHTYIVCFSSDLSKKIVPNQVWERSQQRGRKCGKWTMEGQSNQSQTSVSQTVIQVKGELLSS